MKRNLRLAGFHAAAVLAALALPVLSGCASYRIGSTLPPGIRSVHVPTFINKTDEPLLESQATSATIREFIRDGTVRIADAAAADAVVQVTLKSYTLTPLRYEKEEVRTAREYRLTLTAEVVLQKAIPQKVLLTRTVNGEATFFPAGDLTTGKQEALPRATKDLAHDIVECVIEFW